MTIDDLYKKLSAKQFTKTLKGDLSFEDETIKWSFDGLLYQGDCAMEELLIDAASSDKELIVDLLNEQNASYEFNITEPEYDDPFVNFYITE